MNLKQQKFLVDLGVGKSIESWLAQEGYNVACIRDINPRITDTEILSIAISESRIVITMDKDFGELAFGSGAKHSGVLLLRLDAATSLEKLAVVREIMQNYSHELPDNFCVYMNGRLRIRKH